MNDKEKPTWEPKLYAIWCPSGGPDDRGSWWQSDGADFGPSPVVFFHAAQAENYASSESWHWNDDKPLQVWDVSDWTSPAFVRLCRATAP